MSHELLSALKSRPEWVCWTYEERDGDKTKPPIAPYDGQHYAKSNDPDTWRPYEEAVAYHEREDTDTEGVGLMLSDEGIIVGVDLDGCRNPETGEAEPWAEEIIDRLDTYTEVSPSASGFRAFVLGMLPEGRNKRKQERTIDLPEWVREEKNAEVEVYDRTRYMTFTGEHVDGTPTEAQERASVLKEVHAEYVAREDGQSDLSSSSGTPEDVDVNHDRERDGDAAECENEFGVSLSRVRERDEKLDALLSRLEPAYSLPNDDDSGSGYDMAAASKLWFWRFDEQQIADILRTYRWRDKLSRADYVDRTIEKAKGGERYTPGRSVDGDDGEDEKPTPEEARAALDALLTREAEREDDNDTSADTLRRAEKLLALLDEDGRDDLRARVAELFDTSESAVEFHADLANHRYENGPILSENGATFYLTGCPTTKQQILNFELDVESFLKVPGEPMRAALRVLADAEEFEKRIEPKVFNDRQRFEDEVLGERFGLTFDPGPASAKDLLSKLNEWVERSDAPVREGTHHMGVHGAEFVTPSGSLTADGWTDEPSVVYLERDLAIERRLTLSAESAEFDAEGVGRILRELPRTRDTERFLPVLSWFYAALFRPNIYEWEGGFNLLNVTGDTGSGKTTTLRYLWRCVGMQGEPFDARDTKYVLTTTFGATNSLPVWHDEYKPSDMSKYEVDTFHDMIRKTATGSVAQRGKADGSTKEYELAAPSVISGEQQIQPPAERRRSIMVQFREAVTKQGTDTRRRFKELTGGGVVEDGELQLADDAPDPTDHALAYYQFVTGLDDTNVRTEWLEAREFVWKVREEWAGEYDLDDMEIQGLQTVVFGYRMYHRFAESLGVDAGELPTETELKGALKAVAETVGPDGARKSHLDRFVEILERAAAADYLEEDQHYTFVHEGKPEEELRVHIPRAYDRVSKYVRDHDLGTEELLDAAAYKDRFKTAAEEDGNYVTGYGKRSPPLARCAGISTIKAMNELDFNRQTFGAESMSADPSPVKAAADGGKSVGKVSEPPADSEGLQADIDRLVYILDVKNGGLSKAEALKELKERYDVSLPSGEQVLDAAISKKGVVLPPGDDGVIRLNR